MYAEHGSKLVNMTYTDSASTYPYDELSQK